MPFVLDSSVTMAWCFPDEAIPYTESVFDRLWETEAIVPMIWPLEVSNVLLIAKRNQRISAAATLRFVRLLQSLAITVYTTAATDAFASILDLGREHGLSAYDAAYLELAMREGLPLATLDQRLRAAAERVGVPLVE